MVIDELINKNKQGFCNLCKEHNVIRLFAFGSAVITNFDFDKSDIDLLVEIEENDPLLKREKILSFWDKTEEIYKRKVDLITKPKIRNPYLRKSVNDSKVLIYGRSHEKIPG